MLSLATAKNLKAAGLSWEPVLHDLFVVPDRGFDDKVFVISDVFANVEWLRGYLSVTFQGSVEWALDYVMVAELVWLPSETQLRQELQKRLAAERQPALQLTSTPDGCACEIQLGDQRLRFEASDGSQAYAAALLHVLEIEKPGF
jgi:hypothetical protein